MYLLSKRNILALIRRIAMAIFSVAGGGFVLHGESLHSKNLPCLSYHDSSMHPHAGGLSYSLFNISIPNDVLLGYFSVLFHLLHSSISVSRNMLSPKRKIFIFHNRVFRELDSWGYVRRTATAKWSVNGATIVSAPCLRFLSGSVICILSIREAPSFV